MSRNPKVTIALAFVLTFLIGVGAGYLFRGEVQLSPADRGAVSLDETSRGWRADDADQENRVVPDDRRTGLRGELRDESGWGQRDYDDRPRTDRDRRDDARRYRDQEPDSRDRHEYGRMKERLKKELSLSDETAEAFFNILELHREQVKENILDQQKTIRAQYQELGEELEEELSEVLTPEQMEMWQEKFAPRLERYRRGMDDNR